MCSGLSSSQHYSGVVLGGPQVRERGRAGSVPAGTCQLRVCGSPPVRSPGQHAPAAWSEQLRSCRFCPTCTRTAASPTFQPTSLHPPDQAAPQPSYLPAEPAGPRRPSVQCAGLKAGGRTGALPRAVGCVGSRLSGSRSADGIAGRACHHVGPALMAGM